MSHWSQACEIWYGHRS